MIDLMSPEAEAAEPGEFRDDARIEIGEPRRAPLMERLRYGTALHDEVLAKLTEKRDFSESHIEKRYDAWNEVREHQQLYIDLERGAKRADKTYMTKEKEMPFERAIVVPMSYTILQVLMTQLLSIFTAQEPIFKLRGRGPEDIRRAIFLESLLHYDAQATMIFARLWHAFRDALCYGCGALYDTWERELGEVTKYVNIAEMVPGIPPELVTQMLGPAAFIPIDTWGVQREFTNVEGISPFNLRPDPRVPLHMCQKGEFIGHEFKRHQNYFKRLAAPDGPYFNLEHVTDDTPADKTEEDQTELGIENTVSREAGNEGFWTCEHLQIEIIPNEWPSRENPIGDTSRPQRWWFTWANDSTIIRAHPNAFKHDRFTYSLLEPNPDFSTTFNPGMLELADSSQRFMNWMFNSYVENLVRMLNNQYIYAPELLTESDVEFGGPGQHIRLTDDAVNMMLRGEIQDVRQFFFQVQVQDVTGPSYMNAIQYMFDMSQRMFAANDTVMAQPLPTSRTATEVGAIVAKASDRLTLLAKFFDVTAIEPLVSRMISNRQQLTTMEQYVRIIGDASKDYPNESIWLSRDNLAGNYDYIPNSGLMPEDPGRQAQVFINLLQVAGNVPQVFQPDPQTGRTLDPKAIFNEAARRSGVRNLDQFYIQVIPDEQLAMMAQSGQAVPMQQMLPGGGGPQG